MGHDNRAMPAKIDEGKPQTWTRSWLDRRTKAQLFEIALRHGIAMDVKQKSMMVSTLWLWKQDKETEAEKQDKEDGYFSSHGSQASSNVGNNFIFLLLYFYYFVIVILLLLF